jgi:hypothetical protein
MTYTVTIHRTHSLLKLTYKKGELCKIEIKSGGLNSQQYQQLGAILPPQEEDIERYQKQCNGSVSYIKDEQQTASLYTQFLDEWFSFYKRLYGFPPKFTGADGKALKQIISYLQQVSNDAEALSTWQYLLGNWQKMDAFHQKNTDLKYINSQLNKILQNAKRGNSSTTTAYSDNFKREILDGLCPR